MQCVKMTKINLQLKKSLGNVLVIGGSGFVGRHCLRHVLKDGGPDVRVYTLNQHVPEVEHQIPNVTYLQADLGDATAVQRAVHEANPKVVIHLASPKPFVERPTVYERVNIQGIKNLLTACDKTGAVKALVYCSSVSIIDNGTIQKLHGDESSPVLYAPEQKDPYWHSKAVGEALVLGHNAKVTGMLTTALRVTSVFGEDDDQIIGGIIRQAQSGTLNVQLGDGKNLNCWTYVGNVVDAHIHAARCLLGEVDLPSKDREVAGEAFFITNDDPRPFWAFTRQVAAAAGYPVKMEDVRVLPRWMAWYIGYLSEWVVFVTSAGRRKAEVSRKTIRYAVCEQVLSMEKAKRVLGWRPVVGVDEAVERSAGSFRGKS